MKKADIVGNLLVLWAIASLVVVVCIADWFDGRHIEIEPRGKAFFVHTTWWGWKQEKHEIRVVHGRWMRQGDAGDWVAWDQEARDAAADAATDSPP